MTQNIQIYGAIKPEYKSILTNDALLFLIEIHREFNNGRLNLLNDRKIKQKLYDSGMVPKFLESTSYIRESEWKGPTIPADLIDRRIEITGPAEPKMIVNALKSGANVFMADFEDSISPTWDNLMLGQVSLLAANKRALHFESGGKHYSIGPNDKKLATLLVRPRGWHLDEEHVYVDNQPMSGALFDFALYFYHNAKLTIERGSGPYFYLPKMESHLEARLWNSVFIFAQERCEIQFGTIRATVLIETLPAAFEMDEIIYELRNHSSGLNCGRWDYIFNFIKKLQSKSDKIFPNRSTIGMDRPFLRSYVQLLIKTCHRRGVHAMGGMSAFIPIKDNATANDAVMNKVKNDKLVEVKAGHDGTWVAHPGLIPVAKKVFDEFMPGPNQLNVHRNDSNSNLDDLLRIGNDFEITEAGLRSNIEVSLRYIEAWLSGKGCVPIHNLMEDAATAEISRTQIWQWIHHQVKMKDGRIVDRELVQVVFQEILSSIREESGNNYAKTKFVDASNVLLKLLMEDKLSDFLTTYAYPLIVKKVVKSNL